MQVAYRPVGYGTAGALGSQLIRWALEPHGHVSPVPAIPEEQRSCPLVDWPRVGGALDHCWPQLAFAAILLLAAAAWSRGFVAEVRFGPASPPRPVRGKEARIAAYPP